MKNIILVIVVLAILGAIFYFGFYKKKTDVLGGTGDTTDNGDNGGNGNTFDSGQINTGLGFRSVKITSGATTAQDPSTFFNNIPLSNVASYNVRTSSLAVNQKRIHFDLSFNDSCQKYIWYNNILYTFIGSKTDDATGAKTCYYEFRKESLPAKIQISVPSGPCSVYNYYLGDVRYQYRELYNIPNTALYFCIYDKK